MTVPMVQRGTSDDLVGLLAAVARQDRSAFGELYDRTSAKMYGICRRMMNSDTDAEDVLHEAYLTVWRNAGRFDASKASPITWLAVLTRNKAIDRLRRERSAEPIDAAEEVADGGPSAVDIISEDQDRQRLAKCLDQIDSRTSGLIRSAFFTGATYPELAAEMAVPLGTMKSWIRRGLMSLRGCLEQ
jgi:RNA polymerase sigma-70 factor (ECF subfamily)